MNICMFTNTYLPHVGGVARSVAWFAEDLQALRHQVLVIAPVFEDDLEEEREEDILRVPAIKNVGGSDFSLGLALPFKIANKITEFNPDIIHSHHPYLLGDAALRTAWRRNVPLVFTHHTLYEKYTHYVSLDYKNVRRFVINLSTEYANLCSRVIAPSRSVAELIQERGVVTPVEEIPTGVDLDFFAQGRRELFRQEQGIPENTLVIGHVGRLAPEKNLQYLSEAVAHFLRDHKGIFLVVGGGPSREVIRDVFRDMNLDKRLLLAGKKTGRELSDAYNAMDLFVFSSKTETQGMVLVEAMAAGRPVIALDASGAREVVVDRQNGRLLPEDTPPEGFAQAIKEFARDPGTAREWQQGALETARPFSRKKIAHRLVRLYEGAIAEFGGKYRNREGINVWDKFIRGLNAEWALLSQKAAASAALFNESEE